jgi:TPR repeat protein
MSLFWKNDHDGFGIDYDKALAFAHQAIDLGYVAGWNLLGDMHSNGHGVEEDKVKALEFYRKSADLGHAGGYREVGYAYYHGDGVDQNMALVLTYLDQAVALGDTKSLPDLAYLYEGNDGIGRDLTKSYLLYRRALEFRMPRAAYELALFANYEGYPGYWHNKVEAYGYCLLAIGWGHTLSEDNITLECAKIAEGFSDKQIAKAQSFAKALK